MTAPRCHAASFSTEDVLCLMNQDAQVLPYTILVVRARLESQGCSLSVATASRRSSWQDIYI